MMASLSSLSKEEQEICHGLVIIITYVFSMLESSCRQALRSWEIIAEAHEDKSENFPRSAPRMKQYAGLHAERRRMLCIARGNSTPWIKAVDDYQTSSAATGEWLAGGQIRISFRLQFSGNG
jgi:hypothetical protein